jgi:hypothetical protein
VKLTGRRKRDTPATAQLGVGIEWLAGRLPGSFLAMPEVPPSMRDIAQRVEEIMRCPELLLFLTVVEQHNRRPHWEPGRRLPQKDNFLLCPHLFQVLISVESRNELHQRLPVLDQPASEVRMHLLKAATDCKGLAALIRKGPQPGVALAGATSANEVLKVFAPWSELFEAADDSERQIVAFSDLIGRAAAWFDALATHVPRAAQNRHTGNGALRVRAAEFLPGVFRKRLGQPHHAHVATIATIVSGIPTDADFVKKVEARQSEPSAAKSGTD